MDQTHIAICEHPECARSGVGDEPALMAEGWKRAANGKLLCPACVKGLAVLKMLARKIRET